MTVSELLRIAPQAAPTLKKWGIASGDGGIRFEEACKEAGVLPGAVKARLKAVCPSTSPVEGLTGWPAPELISNKLAQHHQLIKRSIAGIRESFQEVFRQYAPVRAELTKIKPLIDKVAEGLELHIHTEGKILFPAIKRMATDSPEKDESEGNGFPLAYPLEAMEDDHREALADLGKIRILSRGHRVPGGTNSNFHLLYTQLQQLEKHLRQAVLIEDGILFPAALKLEGKTINGATP